MSLAKAGLGVLTPNPEQSAEAQKQFKRWLFKRYDRRPMVFLPAGISLGLDISDNPIKYDFQVNYTHFHPAVEIPGSFQSLERLDDRTFKSVGRVSRMLPSLPAQERLRSSKFYLQEDRISFHLISLAPGRFETTGGLVARKLYGAFFHFVFPRSIIEAGDYDAVVREVDQYLLPEEEFRQKQAERPVLVRREDLVPAPPQKGAPAERSETAVSQPAEPQRRIETQVGMSRDEVIQALGLPQKEIVFGNKTILVYPELTVALVDGKVTEVNLKK